MKQKAQASGLLQPRHPTQAARFSHEHAFNPLSPDTPRSTIRRSKWKSHLACPLRGRPTSWERCVSDGSSVHSSEVEGRQKSLTDAPGPPNPRPHTQAHTHTRTQAETPGNRGPGAQCNRPAFLERLRKGHLTRHPRAQRLCWLAPEAVTACLALALAACGQEKCSEHLLLLEQHEIIPQPGVLPELGEPLNEPGGHPGPSGLYCFAAQGQAPGGSSPQKPSKINQSDGVSMGLHGPASRKTLTL